MADRDETQQDMMLTTAMTADADDPEHTTTKADQEEVRMLRCLVSAAFLFLH